MVHKGKIDLAVDTTSAAIPFAPAGASKVARLVGKKIEETASKAKHTFPDEIWTGKVSKQVTPGTKSIDQKRFNSETGKLEYSKVYYDQYGRMKSRTDYTDHGYGNKRDPKNYHSDPHTHTYEYSAATPGGKEMRINHDE